ncbi:MAG: hypothetical protein ABJM29_04220 [Rhizobiaceae bacterium]
MDTVTIQRGQWVPMRLTFWADIDKTAPVDLSEATVSICEASQTELLALDPIISNAAAGIVDIEIDETLSRKLTQGRTNWLIVEAQFAASNIVVPRIWISANV